MAIGSNPIEDDPASAQAADPAELVHEARKTIKRMRALARMLRGQLGKQEFKRVNALLREAGQRLAGARDADVRLATLEELIERYPNALARPGKNSTGVESSGERPHPREGIKVLEQQLQRERSPDGQPPSDIEQVLVDIAAMRDQLAHWSLVDTDFETLAPGLQRIYREGRHRYKRCSREQGRGDHDHDHDHDQNIHDWRKRVKSLYYALDMLGAKKVKGARRATRLANRLGDLLGSEHDLWMLCAYVEDHAQALGADTAARDELLRLIERRRRLLRKRALKLGARLYKRRPASFTRRIGRALAR